MNKLLRFFIICAFTVGTTFINVSFAYEINKSKGQKEGVQFKINQCKPEKGVKFTANENTRLTSNEIENLLTGNTLLSVDRYGTFAIYYPSNKETVGWMPKLKKEKYSWSRGTVSFKNGMYCRQWKEWKSGKKENCWAVHRGEQRIDMPTLYFVCRNGVADGDQSVVFNGNYFNIKYKGNGAKSGKLTQDDQKAKDTMKKYFGNYVNK